VTDIKIDGQTLTLEAAISISRGHSSAILCEDARLRMAESRKAVESIIESGKIIYGINTGFGAMSSVKIGEEDLEKLQANLIRSHACGVGHKMEPEHVLLMMVFRANSLAKGVSGIRPEIVELLLDMVNNGIAPVIPRIGSLGASGDLAPLSHMALAILGEGESMVRNETGWETIASSDALGNAGLKPSKLAAKEGLSLINGTSQMCCYLALTLTNLDILINAADASAAASLEAIKGSHAPYDSRIHEARPQLGQSESSTRIRGLLKDSDIKLSHADCDRVQDAYCFRCVPQVHGPVIDLLNESKRMLDIEINSATDNPLVFVKEEEVEVLSGGNFHGQNLALASDNIAVACHELASISERRMNQVLDPKWSDQIPFLALNEGLESGYMIVQYVAAACLAELHLLANPVTTSNVPVSMGKEDHVSMGATGTYRSLQSTILLSQVLANELICSTEALDRIPNQPGTGVGIIYNWVRSHVAKYTGDKVMSDECSNLSDNLLKGHLKNILG